MTYELHSIVAGLLRVGCGCVGFVGSVRVWDEPVLSGWRSLFLSLATFLSGWTHWRNSRKWRLVSLARVVVVVVVVAEPHPLPTAISPVFDSRRQPKTAHPSFLKPGRSDFSRRFWQNCHRWNILSDLYLEEEEEKKRKKMFCLMFYFYELRLANCVWNV